MPLYRNNVITILCTKIEFIVYMELCLTYVVSFFYNTLLFVFININEFHTRHDGMVVNTRRIFICRVHSRMQKNVKIKKFVIFCVVFALHRRRFRGKKTNQRHEDLIFSACMQQRRRRWGFLRNHPFILLYDVVSLLCECQPWEPSKIPGSCLIC